MPSTERRLRRIDEKRPDTGGGAIVPPGGGAPAGAPAVGVPGVPQSVRIVNTFLLHSQGQGLAGANVAWAAPTGTSPDSYLVQWDVASGFTAPTTRTAPRGQLSIALDAMPTGATVYVRVAALIGGVQGAWSATASAATPSDTTPPSPVTGLAFSWSGLTGDLTISWTNPTSTNLRDVRVRIYASNGGAMLREVFWPGQSYVWTRGQQYADTGGAFDPSVYVVVTARSWGGAFSTDATGTATPAAPATPAGLTHSWAGDAGTAGAGLLVTWTLSSAVAGYRLSVDGTARDVGLTGRYEYGFTQNQAEHAGAADPVLSLSLVAVDALGQTSSAATATATNAAPPATTITVFAGFSTVGLTIGASAAQDLKDYRVRVYKAGSLVKTVYFTDTRPTYAIEDGDGSYTFDVAARDVFGQIGTASAQTTATAITDMASFVANLRSGLIYTDSIGTAQSILADLKDGNLTTNVVTYASGTTWKSTTGDWQEEITHQTSEIALSATASMYIGTSLDGSTWTWFSGGTATGGVWKPVAQASEAAAQTAAASLTAGTWAVDLPAPRRARYIRIGHRNTGSAYVLREFFPSTLLRATYMQAESITARHIAAGAILADKIAATALDGFVITGATIRTAASGERVVIDSTGFKTYDSLGNVVAEASTATDGGIYLRRGVSAPLRIIEDSSLNEIGRLWGSEDSLFFGLRGGLGVFVELAADDGTAVSKLSMRPDGIDSEATFTHSVKINKGLRIGSTAGGLADVSVVPGDGGIAMTGGLNIGSATGAGAGQVVVAGSSSGYLWRDRTVSTLWSQYSTGGQMQIENAVGGVVSILTNAGNMIIDGTLTESSDARLKSNIRPLGDVRDTVRALGRLARLYERDGLRSGFVAQDIAAIPALAHLVTTGIDGMLALNYTGLIAYLAAALGGLLEERRP